MSLTPALIAIALSVGSPASAGDLPTWTPDPNATYEAIPDVYKWDLAALFDSDQAWADEATRVEGELERFATFHGQLSDPAALLDCLEFYFQTHGAASRVALYASLRGTTARSDTEVIAMEGRSQALMMSLMDEASFIRSEVLVLPEKKMAKAYKKAPGLEQYRTYLDGFLRRRDRVLSPEAERVLGLWEDNLWAEVDLNELHSPSELAYRALITDLEYPMVRDEEGNEVRMTLALYPRLRSSEDREVRREAVEALFSTLRQFDNTFAATLGGQASTTVGYAQARRYDTALEAYLDKDALDVAVYENLISTVNDNLEPLHRYVELRRKVLGVDKVHLYDMYPALLDGVEKEVPYDDARQTILTALAPLGEDYLSVMGEGMDPETGWLDLYPSSDKRSGAFCASTHGIHPYVMMNYQDSLEDMSTLAHEYGHAMHSHLSMTHQAYPDYAYVPFLAEIASTANEVLLLDHLIAQAESDDEKMYLLTQRADGIRGTIYRQAMFAEFEWAVHRFVEEGVPVTGELLDQTYRELVQRYYGPSYELGENDGMEWSYIPHFYYKYYVFTYATGLSSGIAIARYVKEGGDEAVAAYMTMLEGGRSAPPLELLKGAGVDLSSPAPIEAALKLFDETVTELDALFEARAERLAEEAEGSEAEEAEGSE